MDQLRESIARGDLVQDVRRLLQGGAQSHGTWLRENLRHALVVRRQDAVAIAALTGLAPGTVRGFLNGRPSSIDNVLIIVEAVGFALGELDQPPEQFRHYVQARLDGATGGVIANSLNPDTGDVAAVRIVGREEEELMLITELGTILRTEVGGINRYRRPSRGVTVMKPADGDRIVSITVFVDNRPPEEATEAE